MEMKLRPYQIDAINRVNENLKLGKKVQYVLLPLGAGKSVIACNIIKSYIETGKKILVLFTRKDELSQFRYVLSTLNLSQEYVKLLTVQKLYRLDNQDDDSDLKNGNFKLIISLSNTFLFNNLKDTHLETTLFEKTINKISDKNNAPIIYFEQSPISENLENIPLLSTSCTCYLSNRQFAQEFNASFVEERSRFEKNKVLSVQENNVEKKEQNNNVIAAIEALAKKIDANHSETAKKLDALHADVKEILTIVKQINDATKNYKDILQTYYELHSEESTESDIFTSRIISKLMEEISNQLPKIQNDDQYNKAKRLVEIRLSNVLNKMDEESKKFLITAKFLFLQNMDLENSIDYSSICLLSSKAFEVELSKRLVLNFQDFLDRKGIAFENWPSSMISTYKKDNHIIKEKLSLANFSLGSCPYIMGLLGNSEIKDYNRNLFIQFCNESLMSGKSQEEINSSIKKVDNYIRYVKDNFRNPAAHKQTMTISDATNCLDYILEVEKVLRDTLEVFNY